MVLQLVFGIVLNGVPWLNNNHLYTKDHRREEVFHNENNTVLHDQNEQKPVSNN